jgi:hypothetical protein
VANYKNFIQNQLKKAKSTASELISSRDEDDDTLQLDAEAYDELKKMADLQHTSVQAIAHGIIDQYLESVAYNSTPISVEQKEDNPLLYLDAICKNED